MNNPATNNESSLVVKLSKGNLLAFNSLYHNYNHRLYRFALGYLKSESEAEELVQEVFTIIWEKRATLREDLSFKSFLFTIAFNLIRKHFRTKNYLIEYFKAEINTDVDTQTSDKVAYNSLFQYVSELVKQLPGRRRDIFIKSRFEGLSIKEISEELHISHKTVENQLTVTLKFLRKNLNLENVSDIKY